MDSLLTLGEEALRALIVLAAGLVGAEADRAGRPFSACA